MYSAYILLMELRVSALEKNGYDEDHRFVFVVTATQSETEPRHNIRAVNPRPTRPTITVYFNSS